ncbi:MAG: hypothetical protein EOO88_50740, partial [Pedobacter sp.]
MPVETAKQTIITSPSITLETDELDPAFPKQAAAVDPEDKENETDGDNPDLEKDESEQEDYNLNHDAD